VLFRSQIKLSKITEMNSIDELAHPSDSSKSRVIIAKASCSGISIASHTSTSTNTSAVTNNLKYICEICGYLIENSANLKAHLKSHQHAKATDVNNNATENDDSEKCKFICYEAGDNKAASFRFIDESNLFVCSLCNCNYDSLRSIKAHLWKHSGHHHLSYPINEAKNEAVISTQGIELEPANYVEITTSCGSSSIEITKEAVESKLEVKDTSQESSENTCEEAAEEAKCAATPTSTRAGICSALLQVIEQLRCEESNRSEFEETDPQKTDKKITKRKSRAAKSTSDDDDSKIKKKRGRKRKIDAILAENDRKKLEAANAVAAKATEIFAEINIKSTRASSESSASLPKSLNCLVKSDLLVNANKRKEIVSIKSEFVDALDDCISIIQPQTMAKQLKMCSTLFIDTNNYSSSAEKKFISLLMSLSTNDGQEQYVCGLCPYVCYHLPSLKSHMWTHVTNAKFDYSLNTMIINAAIDYENRLNRQLQQLKSSEPSKMSTNFDLNSFNQLVTYPLEAKISASIYDSKAPIVTFRCSKCGYATIDLSILRLHKRQHYVRIISSSNLQSKFQLISSENSQKDTCCSVVASL